METMTKDNAILMMMAGRRMRRTHWEKVKYVFFCREQLMFVTDSNKRFDPNGGMNDGWIDYEVCPDFIPRPDQQETTA